MEFAAANASIASVIASATEQAVQAKVEYQKALRAAETKEKLEEGRMITAP